MSVYISILLVNPMEGLLLSEYYYLFYSLVHYLSLGWQLEEEPRVTNPDTSVNARQIQSSALLLK